ncbi:MAG TPA: 2-amino-4-hydroxy-6-hydroxymethyldihydropteridine diphosphokinase [Burkholderiales bacterium]
MTTAFVALGANLDDPKSQVLRALEELDRIPGSRVVSRSSLYRTAPVGYLDQPDFINAVAHLDTTLEARPLLDALHQLENRHGRRRTVPNAPRTLDLDLLLYADRVINEEGLTLPHPRLHERAFVLAPLAEIAPDAIVPGQGRVGDLLDRIDRSGVELIDGS